MNVLIHLFHYIGKRKRLVIGVVFFIILAQIAELAIPILVGTTIDSILEALQAGTFKVDVLLMGVFLILFFSILRGLTYFLARWLGYIQGEGIIFDIRKDLFNTYENSSLDFFDKFHTGDLMSRATTDLEPMGEFLVWGERIFLQAFLTYTGIYTVLFLIDIRLFILLGVVTPLLFVLAYFVSTKLGPLYFKIRNQYGVLTTVIQENIAGAQIVRAFNAEHDEKEKFDQENLKYMSLRAYAFKIRSFFLPLILLVVNVLITLLIYAGGIQVIDGEISPGFLITLFSYFTMLAMPTRFLAFALIMYQRVSAAGERVFTLIESPNNIETCEN
ncbi:MAG: ABC transporter ATP-binding protein, partial [Candidatus Hodarchaeales archaeon]